MKIYEYLNSNEFHERIVNPKQEKYIIGIVIVTKIGIGEVSVEGPTYTKRGLVCDYSIYIPEIIETNSKYLRFVGSGLEMIFLDFRAEDFVHALSK